MHEQLNDTSRELINEPGSIGEETLPAGAAGKNDKQDWTYAADRNQEDSTWWDHIQKFLRRHAGGT